MTLIAGSDGSVTLYNGLGCHDCGGPVSGRDRFCALDKARRRSISYLRAAYRAAEPLGRGALLAIHHAEVAVAGQRPSAQNPQEENRD